VGFSGQLTFAQETRIEQRSQEQQRIVSTMFGTFSIDASKEKVLLDVIDSSTMQRLKLIRQFGMMYYINPKEYSRYDHSLGVWALIRRFGGSINEQIAGLLHDASHTVFSHVADFLFCHSSEKCSYQDSIHEWFLTQQHIPELLEKHGIALADILHKSGDHKLLEQDLPDLCADRIEYNFTAGVLSGFITAADIETMLKDLVFENEKWIFTSVATARRFSDMSVDHTEQDWGSPGNFIAYTIMADAMQRALDLGLVTKDQIHFSDDQTVWDTLCASNDPTLKKYMAQFLHHRELITVTTKDSCDMIIATKFRGVNPLVKVDGKLVRLTDCDQDYKKKYDRVKTIIKNGWPITFAPSFAERARSITPIIS
jgi:hypothetical protein